MKPTAHFACGTPDVLSNCVRELISGTIICLCNQFPIFVFLKLECTYLDAFAF